MKFCVLRQIFKGGDFFMEKRIAVLSIIVEENAQTDKINEVLHKFKGYIKGYIKGRLGLPEINEGISVICIVLDAPNDIINNMTGKIGMIEGVKAKSLVR